MSQEEASSEAWPPEGWDGILEGETSTYKEVVEIAQKAAEAGNATAQYVLGAAHYFGKGVEENKATAFEWYFKAAAQGLAHAQHNLGVMYERGEACPQSHAKALLWYEKAAAQGLPKAQHNLAVLYEAGLGAARNEEKAAQHFEEAAKHGDVRAQYRLALLLLHREGAPLQEGIGWLQKALEQNFAPAKYSMGFLLENGVGVEKNLAKARHLYEEAALQGVAEAQAALERLP